MKILLLGNCHMQSIHALLSAAGHRDITILRFSAMQATDWTVAFFEVYDLVIVQDIHKTKPFFEKALGPHKCVVYMPVLFFNGLTPDDETWFMMRKTKSGNNLPVLSRIAVGALRNRLSADEAHSLYSPIFCDFMGYDKVLKPARENLIQQLSSSAPNISTLFDRWMAKGVFYHMSLHPKLYVFEDVLRSVMLKQVGIVLPQGLHEFCPDPLQVYAGSPQFNHPLTHNLVSDPNHRRKHGQTVLSCRQFIDVVYNTLHGEKELLEEDRPENKIFDMALAEWNSYRPRPTTVNPYRKQPDSAFWGRFVARPDPSEISPTDRCQPIIGRDTRVATAGSCFAQHVARALSADGLTYHVTEPAPKYMTEDEALKKTYGLFSARYGNIYTSLQLLQLFQRAYGTLNPVETVWPVQGGFVDPFRPNIGEVFETPEAVEKARQTHLACVREMFETLEVFVFTMGLTEGWVDRRDGTVFPVAPAAISNELDENNYEFRNGNYATIREEVLQFLEALASVNPTARVILTVSPVPLIATYSGSDVLSATTYSKSVLRSVAGDLALSLEKVSYFPSYEIITGAHAGVRYFHDDLRSVRSEGVEHVMRVFRQALVDANLARLEQPKILSDHEIVPTYSDNLNIVCDEEIILRDAPPQVSTSDKTTKSKANRWWRGFSVSSK